MKIGENDTMERYEARLVAQSFIQTYGAEYDETFCPVARQESLRMLLALSMQYRLKLEVYMAQLEGFVSPGQEYLVCKLKKSILYGLKQSPCCWNTALDAYLKQIGFTQSNSDPCIHFKETGGEKCTWVCMSMILFLLQGLLPRNVDHSR